MCENENLHLISSTKFSKKVFLKGNIIQEGIKIKSIVSCYVVQLDNQFFLQ